MSTHLAVLPNGDMVAGGGFTQAGGVSANYVARWDGTAWSALGTGINNYVEALAVQPNGDLIAGGLFSIGGSPSIARWNGTAWSALGSGMNHIVYALAAQPSGDLVAGGQFTTAGGVGATYIARWNGTAWSAVGSGMDSQVSALAVLPNGDLVAGGAFTMAGGAGARNIARWNGASWSPLGSGMSSDSTSNVNALAVLPNGDLVVGGEFTAAGGVRANYIARWNGTAWFALGTGMTGATNPIVSALVVLPNGDLVAGGFFPTAGGVGANHIARWNGAAWSALGTGMNYSVYALAILPNGELPVGGGFLTAGGNVSAYWARYTFGGTSPVITAQPVSAFACPNGTAAFSVTAAGEGGGPLAYQWQIETAPGTWQTLGNDPFPLPCGQGAFAYATPINSPTVQIGIRPCPGVTGYQVRAVVSNDCGSATSGEATYTICAADFDCSGAVNSQDFFDFLGAFFAGAPGADFNHSGAVDSQDFFDFLTAFFAGCG